MKLIKKILSDPKMRVCLLFIFLFSLLFGFNQAFAQSYDAHTAKLVEGAKKEKTMTWYSSMSVNDSVYLIDAFQKKYPFIKAKHYRSSSVKLMSKVATEASLGKYLFDVISAAPTRGIIYIDMGVIAPYHTPERKFYADEFKDKEGYWTSYTFNTHVIAYNTKMISPAEAPRNYQDLLDPKWKGKLGVDSSDFSWYAAQLEIMGEEKGRDYFNKLSKQQLNVRRGHTLLTQLCVAGEFPIVVNAYAQSVEKYIAAGAPVQWVPVNPVAIHTAGLMLGKNARHPNAGKLWIDFMLSRQGQEIVRDRKRIPCRSDVLPDPPRLVQGLKFHPLPYAHIAKNYAKLEAEWLKLIKRK